MFLWLFHAFYEFSVRLYHGLALPGCIIAYKKKDSVCLICKMCVL